MMEIHVERYLEERIKREDCHPDMASVIRVMIREYRRAVRRNNWGVSRVIGELMIEVSQCFRSDPDYPGKFARP